MKLLKTLINYFLYCGIEKEEYNAVKKDAYVSNFFVWRIIHCMMVGVFFIMTLSTLSVEALVINRTVYLLGLFYSVAAAWLFFFALREDSIAAQLVIYLSISVLFLLGCLISQNWPEQPAVTFVVLLLITPMFMIDKPYFMALELTVASAIFLWWMRPLKPAAIWNMDLGNITIYGLVGVFLHVISNSVRIREFVLSRQIKIQKDTDELTGLKNKGALTREIDAFLADKSRDRGTLFMMDLNRFKAINDTYGHDVGDSVLRQFGLFLRESFPAHEILGRFGGDEFILFLKDTDDPERAAAAARRIVEGAPEAVPLPDDRMRVGVGVGVALYHGEERSYSELFKKADMAMYKTKTDRSVPYSIYH